MIWHHDSLYISQFFGILAIVANIVKFTRHGRRRIILWGLPVSVFFALSQFFLGEAQGAAVSLIGFLSGFLNLELNRPDQFRLRFGISSAAILMAVTFVPPIFTVWTTFLPFAVFVIARIGQMTHSELRMRSIWLIGTVLWLIYFVATGNYALIASEVLVLFLTTKKIVYLNPRAAAGLWMR
ncbi:YgjV family protein [Acidithiobacillus ferridurans]|uniref:YgjV family protein n=1 Tax=Acidithiobacillus ferridurans TaxID=1232575 RepID=A0A8X8GAL8_ACIFI|nr:YgjV family protein [Acidithiobacillus ferridurans]MBU2715860.1 YgjV family protein [Acidithiobacillus ferridurans]MBU2723418.1 YgjV family protein [Acidithiobacillus ferridurans]MBU2728049.1 YgjV family protein [Acidithiobacillus ferridurans]